MRTALKMTGLITCCAFAIGYASAVLAADKKPAETRTGDKVLIEKTFRIGKLTGLNVRNDQGEKLGTVDDFVVNIDSGKISYMALSVGGLFGLGDKLFAIPFSQVKFNFGKDEMFFVVDHMTPEKLKAAPGFDKSNWPNFADPNWSQHIDSYYQRAQTSTNHDVRTKSTTTTTTTKTEAPKAGNWKHHSRFNQS